MKQQSLIVIILATLTFSHDRVNGADSQSLVQQNKQSLIVAINQEQQNIPAPVIEGLELYKTGDIEGAVNVWTNNMIELISQNLEGTEEETREAQKKMQQFRSVMEGMLTAYNLTYGPCIGYHVIKRYSNSIKNTEGIYVKIEHEKNSFFMEFITLKTPQGTYISHYHFGPNLQDLIND